MGDPMSICVVEPLQWVRKAPGIVYFVFDEHRKIDVQDKHYMLKIARIFSVFNSYG